MHIKLFLRSLIAVMPALFGMLLLPCRSYSQEQEAVLSAADTPSIGRAWLLNLEVLAGTSGLGLGLTERLGAHWEINAGGAWLPFSFGFSSTLSNIKVRNSFDNALGHVHLLVSYNPFLSEKGLRLRGGIAYFSSARAAVEIHTENGYRYGDINLTPEEMGAMNITLRRGGLAPYLGLQFFKVYTRDRFGITADIGTYFLLNSLDVQVTGTGYLQDNEKNEAVLRDNLAGYRWLPQLQLAFHYRLGKVAVPK